jgi:hypothetical protein
VSERSERTDVTARVDLLDGAAGERLDEPRSKTRKALL